MKISTKGKYALQLLLFLAQNQDETYVSLSFAAQKINISKKYLEQIVSILSRTDFLEANRGFQGGYKLSKQPKEISVYDVLKVTETSFSQSDNTNFNEETDNFALYEVFKGLDETIYNYLKAITLEDIKNQENTRLINNYII